MNPMLSSNNSADHLEMTELLPAEVVDAIRNFMLDKLTGNVVLNIKNGVVLGLRTEAVSLIQRKKSPLGS